MDLKRNSPDELQKSNDSKDKLFSILSHDLRNPFFTLQGYIQLLKDESLDEDDKKKCINDLETTANSTYALLENLLNLSAARRGMIEYNPEKFNIRELADQVISNLKPQLDKKYINVENKIEDKEIFADSNMIEIILRNLLSNAIKYSTNNGKIYLSSKTNHSFYISVKDNGIGMNEEIQKNLFKSDFLQSQRGTAGEKGTGIGLSLCKEFIDNHNGEIKVKSKLDEGTEFTFCIPQKN
ncbi:MAG: HAMP domain-containing sensor histidine kinase [Melioribacteraceae bacterium]|nr:HAMP domain-containing sensor histidine kinase [Melioribacteraceae bacterium]